MAVKTPERSEMVTVLLERIGEAVGQKAQCPPFSASPSSEHT
jgi:hypothetical protein